MTQVLYRAHSGPANGNQNAIATITVVPLKSVAEHRHTSLHQRFNKHTVNPRSSVGSAEFLSLFSISMCGERTYDFPHTSKISQVSVAVLHSWSVISQSFRQSNGHPWTRPSIPSEPSCLPAFGIGATLRKRSHGRSKTVRVVARPGRFEDWIPLYHGVSFGESRSRSCSDQWRIRLARTCSG